MHIVHTHAACPKDIVPNIAAARLLLTSNLNFMPFNNIETI